MSEAGGALHRGAVDQVEANNPATAPGCEPGKQKEVRVEKGLAALPAIRWRRMHIEEPQKPDVQWLDKEIGQQNKRTRDDGLTGSLLCA